MALLKVIFPHRDEQGRGYATGDYREVPDHLVEYYQRPYAGIGIIVMAADENTVIKNIAAAQINRESSLEEELKMVEEASKPKKKAVEVEAPVEEEPIAEEAPAEEPVEAEAEVATTKERKRKA